MTFHAPERATPTSRYGWQNEHTLCLPRLNVSWGIFLTGITSRDRGSVLP